MIDDELQTTPPLPAERRREPRQLTNVLLGIIAFALVLFLLVQARFILISLAIAIILFSLTSEAINAIGRLHIGPVRVPSWLASIVALMLIASGLLTATAVLLAQANEVVTMILAYAGPAQRAIAELFGWMGADVEAAVLASMQKIEVAGYLSTLAGQASSLLSAAVLIILFVGFLFAERIWFQAKLINLLGDDTRARHVAGTVGQIMRRVNHYLMVKAMVSVVTSAAVYGVFKVGGYELAMPVAVLTFALNFIPSIGSIIATVIAGLAVYILTQDPASTAGVFLVCGLLQFVIGNVIDPMLMGHALRLSSFGIIISLAFWGAVWGLPGMFLAVPIMVALMISCAQSPTLRPLAVMLSREGLPEDPI
ncbi:AI-2E family transporter [Paenirhodobacter sp. CAU 1674]|jgi:predicted PurR-regulated permease PerM|uniref:AI-2E family transporter n=1 Tax=Paenirhodobacter sp. CAU 1674 TaxID=3032596 RepID=UPI0023DAEBAA|nr:AI-2E family transporter [Paenirhodobacter sp. CAU 1674]MDF2143136.1 AI-2E family transporter [Paenirhodobacter sp. CAU 1674]